MADAAAVVAPVAPQRMDVVEVGPPPPSTAAALGLDQVPGTEFLDKLEDALQKLAAFTFRRIRETLPAAPSTADIEQVCKIERDQRREAFVCFFGGPALACLFFRWSSAGPPKGSKLTAPVGCAFAGPRQSPSLAHPLANCIRRRASSGNGTRSTKLRSWSASPKTRPRISSGAR
eukprot:SAG31_NODE_120_length_23892_cov_10.545623_18_plen_175_part_00